MEKKTTVQLVAETTGSSTFYFKELNGFGNGRLEYTTELEDSSPAAVNGAIKALITNLRFQCPDPDASLTLGKAFQQVAMAVLSRDIYNSFTFSAVHGHEGFVLRVDVETIFQFKLGPQMQSHFQRGFQPWDMSMNNLCAHRSRPVATQGYATYGQRNMGDVQSPFGPAAFQEPIDPLLMLSQYIKFDSNPLAIPRRMVGECWRTNAGFDYLSEHFNQYCIDRPEVIPQLAQLLSLLLHSKRVAKAGSGVLVDEEAYLGAFKDLIKTMGGEGDLSPETTNLCTLAIIDAINRLDANPVPEIEETEKDFREEAELVIFRMVFTTGLFGRAMVDYDPRDSWDNALKAYPKLTEFGRRSLGLEGVGNEISDPAWDAELLEEVLSTPHSTPAAAAAALYVLDVLGRGLPTPVLLEALPSTFVQDFSDYCNALGGEGPFGFTQLNAIKDVLIKRWFITYDTALGVLRTQLDPLGFDIKDPAVARRLELATSSLMEDRTLLFVDSIEK